MDDKFDRISSKHQKKSINTIISADKVVSKPRSVQAISPWQKAISRVRPRLLGWYFLLTAATTLTSLQATRQIFYHSLETRSQDALNQQVQQFRLMADKNRLKTVQKATTLPILFQRLMSNYATVRNEYVLMFTGDRLELVEPQLPADFVPMETVKAWNQTGQPHHGSLTTADRQHWKFAIAPVELEGETGSIVAVHNVSAEFIAIDRALGWVTQIVVIVLALGLLLAWVLIGRVLAPLKLLTRTAQSISESDMHQRIPVKGQDEIAELSSTFNEMLDRLQTAFDCQKEFLKDASHELRTPITVIQGHLEVLGYSTTPSQETIALLMDELDRMTRLVNDLLLLAKADHPHFLHVRAEELDWLTEELFLKSRSLAARTWKLESKGISPIRVDRQRLTQAVMNLIQNAIRHTDAQDTIALGSSVKGKHFYLWVRDTGEGIAPEQQSRIFERFARATRADRDQRANLEGHGLGLAIVSAIAHAHHGWVELESQLNQGSTFTLVLPLEMPNPQPVAHSHASYPHR
jgi:signal transduction histidine kinase